MSLSAEMSADGQRVLVVAGKVLCSLEWADARRFGRAVLTMAGQAEAVVKRAATGKREHDLGPGCWCQPIDDCGVVRHNT